MEIKPKITLPKQLEDYFILESSNGGSYFSINTKYEYPALRIGKSMVGLNKKALDFVGIKNKISFTFLKKDDTLYFVEIPITSNLKGFTLQIRNVTGVSVSKKFGTIFLKGDYKLLEPISIGGLDLFELELIKKIN